MSNLPACFQSLIGGGGVKSSVNEQELFYKVRLWDDQLEDQDNVTADCGNHQVYLAVDNLEEFCVDQSSTIITVLVVVFLVLIIIGLALYNWQRVSVYSVHNDTFTISMCKYVLGALIWKIYKFFKISLIIIENAG